jgi:hypothetical protein
MFTPTSFLKKVYFVLVTACFLTAGTPASADISEVAKFIDENEKVFEELPHFVEQQADLNLVFIDQEKQIALITEDAMLFAVFHNNDDKPAYHRKGTLVLSHGAAMTLSSGPVRWKSASVDRDTSSEVVTVLRLERKGSEIIDELKLYHEPSEASALTSWFFN